MKNASDKTTPAPGKKSPPKKAIDPEILPKAAAREDDEELSGFLSELEGVNAEAFPPMPPDAVRVGTRMRGTEDDAVPDAASLERLIRAGGGEKSPDDPLTLALDDDAGGPSGGDGGAAPWHSSAMPVAVRGDTLDRPEAFDASPWKSPWRTEAIEAEAFRDDGRDTDLGEAAYLRHSEDRDDFRENRAMAREMSRALVPASQADDSDELGKGPGDLVKRYLREISKYPLLTREEEMELAIRFRETGDKQAAWRLTTANLRLVVKIANEYRRQTMKLLDLIQEGNVGLVKAVQKFDPYRGVKLSSYASFWIRAYLLRYIMENFRMVKLGTSQAQRKIFFNLNKERKKLMDAGFEPTPRLLADKMGVSESDVSEMQMRMAADEESMDAPIDSESDRTFGDRFGSEEKGVDEALGDAEVLSLFKSKLKDFEATLDDPREKVIFRERLIAEESPRPLQSIAEQFGLTKERIRQLSNLLMDKMRRWFMREIPEFKMLSVIPVDDAEEEENAGKKPGDRGAKQAKAKDAPDAAKETSAKSAAKSRPKAGQEKSDAATKAKAAKTRESPRPRAKSAASRAGKKKPQAES